MSEKQATVGRIVLFVPPTEDHPTTCNGAKVVPAIVTRVWTNNTVNLTVFADAREPVPYTSATYSSEGIAGTWHWPEEAESVEAAQAKAATAQTETTQETTTQE